MKRNCFYILVLGVAMLSMLFSCRGSQGATRSEAAREARRVEQERKLQEELDRIAARNAERARQERKEELERMEAEHRRASKAQQMTREQELQDQLDELKRLEVQERIDSLQQAIEFKKKNREHAHRMRMRKMQIEEEAMNGMLEEGSHHAYKPCQVESLKGGTVYLMGWGAGEHPTSDNAALAVANLGARNDILANFVGEMEHIMLGYNAQTVPQENGISVEQDLRDAYQTLGRKAINKFFRATCKKAIRTKNGTIKWFVAGRIKMDDVMDKAIKKASEITQINAEELRDLMRKRLKEKDSIERAERQRYREAEARRDSVMARY